MAALDEQFDLDAFSVPEADFDLDAFSTPEVDRPNIQKLYRDRLEQTRAIGKNIASLREQATTFPEGSAERIQLSQEADATLKVLDDERKEFFERRLDDIFLESTPITRTPLAGLGFGAREFVEGQLSLGATGASMFYRAIGADGQADAVNKGMQALRQYNDIVAKQELGRPGQVFSHVLKGLAEMGPIGKTGSLAKMNPKDVGKLLAGYDAISTVNSSLTEGSDRGLKGKDLAGFALANGAATYILGQAANEASLALGGGLGEVVGPLMTRQGTKLAFGQVARDHLVTAAFEALPNGVQSLVNDGLRLTYGVDPNLKANDVLKNALFSATTGAAGGATTAFARAASQNFDSIMRGWGNRVKQNPKIQNVVTNPPESVQVIRADQGPRTVAVEGAAYGPAYQIKKMAVQDLRRLPADDIGGRMKVAAHLRDAEATLLNVRSTPEGRKAATDYLERELADIDDQLQKTELDFATLSELENELIQRPAIPPELLAERDRLVTNLKSMTEETTSLSNLLKQKAGTVAPSPEARNAKLRKAELEPAIEQSQAAIKDVDELIKAFEGDVAAVNNTTRMQLDEELIKLSTQRERLLADREIITDEVGKISDVESQVLKNVKAPPPNQPTSKLVEGSGDYELEALRQRSTNDLREEFGYDRLTTDDKISMDAALRSAIEKGIPDQALKIATETLATRQPMSMEQVVGLGAKVKQHGVRYAELDKASKTMTDPAAKDAIDAEMKIIDSEVATLTEALYRTGTDTARAFAARTRQNWVKLWGPRFKDRMAKGQGSPLTPEQSALADDLIAKITQLDNDLVTLDPRSDEFQDKSFERQSLVNDLEWMKSKAEWNALTKGQKVGRAFTESLNLWRAILTSGDGVPVFRQGAALIGHPIITAKSIPVWYKGFKDAKAAHKFDLESRFGRKNSDLYGDRFFSNLNDPLSARDEQTASMLADRTPILRNFSQAYRAWVNRVRADSFDTIMEANGGRENLPAETINTIRNVVLNGTGRGGLPGLEQSSRAMFAAFLAPRWFTSRFSAAFNGSAIKALYKGDKKGAYIATKEYAKMIAGLGVATYVVEQLGKEFFGEDQVQFHRSPADPNFGRLQVGTQMIDVTGSVAMPIRLLSAAMENLAATVTGDKRERDFMQSAGGAITTRLAPAPSLAAALVQGEVFGEDVTPGVLAKNYAVPWPLGNAIETLMDDGYSQAAASTFMEHFGAGAYRIPEKKFKY